MTSRKPLPKINADTAAFWEGCREHELRIQKCGECGHLRWPPAFLCPHCLSGKTELVRASGRGTVYSYTVYRVAFDPAFRGDLPYVVALVALEAGTGLLQPVLPVNFYTAVAVGLPIINAVLRVVTTQALGRREGV